MSPSRGISSILRARIPIRRPQCRPFSDFVRKATDPSLKSQIYISRARDPYLNLSIEHYLLQKTPADSTVLFLYTNRPCIVIGRNQNPWNEVDLCRVRNSPLGIKIVRRRSGGGAVFHDEGNVNYSVICPTPAFHRDKHAEMIVRALHKLGVQKAKVNGRHDIVVEKTVNGAEQTFKISGSAYKLTRLRSVHHGTCLLSSPNLKVISGFLHSPAKPFIQARGVDSVSSPIMNVGLEDEPFEDAVVNEFNSMYSAGAPTIVGGTEKEVPEIAKGLEELTSSAWIYNQTPLFTFSTSNPTANSYFSSAKLGALFPESIKNISFTAKHGEITEFEFESHPLIPSSTFSHIINSQLHEISDFAALFQDQETSSPIQRELLKATGKSINRLFGMPDAHTETSREERQYDRESG